MFAVQGVIFTFVQNVQKKHIKGIVVHLMIKLPPLAIITKLVNVKESGNEKKKNEKL